MDSWPDILRFPTSWPDFFRPNVVFIPKNFLTFVIGWSRESNLTGESIKSETSQHRRIASPPDNMKWPRSSWIPGLHFRYFYFMWNGICFPEKFGLHFIYLLSIKKTNCKTLLLKTLNTTLKDAKTKGKKASKLFFSFRWIRAAKLESRGWGAFRLSDGQISKKRNLNLRTDPRWN